MEIVLVPGFWLDASSWEKVTPALVRAGHAVHPLTLPGLESVNADRSGIGLRDHVNAVIAAVRELSGPVVLVGHSGGGAIIHGVVDAVPDRITRAIYVDSGPLGDGQAINDELPVENDEVPLPAWEEFEEADLTDLTEELRADFRARAIPEPYAVTSDAQRLSDERRYDVPVTVICCEFPVTEMLEWVAAGHPFVAELARISDVEYVDLPTGHWPQFTRPADLGDVILAAVDRS
jgi:pimeloyl-ACP methyl ester carboxylesterase